MFACISIFSKRVIGRTSDDSQSRMLPTHAKLYPQKQITARVRIPHASGVLRCNERRNVI